MEDDFFKYNTNALDYVNYKSITDSASDQVYLSDLSSKSGVDFSNPDEVNEKMDNLLRNSTLKRACCLHDNSENSNIKKINIKIPIPIDRYKIIDGYDDQNNSYKYEIDRSKLDPYSPEFKFGYINKTIEVDLNKLKNENGNVCSFDGKTYVKNSQDCDDFYKLYCRNVYNTFIKQGGTDEQFQNYSMECQCYGPEPDWVADTGVNIAPKCYKKNCGGSHYDVYQDPKSRDMDCEFVICNADFNVSGVDAGESSNIENVVEQHCGIGRVEELKNSRNNNDPNNSDSNSNNNPNNSDNSNNSNNKSSSNGNDDSESGSTTMIIVGFMLSMICLIIIFVGVYMFIRN